METLQWLEYFTDNISDVHIQVGKQVHTMRRNPDFAPDAEFVLGNPESVVENIQDSAVANNVTVPEFVNELTKIISDETEREKVRSYLTSPLGTGRGSLIEVASEEEVTVGEFFYEISKIITRKEQWENAFSNYGLNLAISGSPDRYRAQILIDKSNMNRSSAVIRRIPGDLPDIIPITFSQEAANIYFT
jgi:hypothetical protein